MKKLGRYLKQFYIIFIFLFTFSYLFSEREIPHEIIKKNPSKEVNEINTLKKRKNPAQLNLTIKKIKTKELELKIDRDRQKIFFYLDDISLDDKLFFMENKKDIPNSVTTSGRQALNRLKNLRNYNKGYKYKIDNVKNRGRKIEIDYIDLPKELYVGVTNNSYKLKKIYKGNFNNYSQPSNNKVTVKLWLFREDMDKVNNIVLMPNRNRSGNIMIRPNNENSSPESAIEKLNTYSVFHMIGKPLNFDFEDNDKLIIENESGIGDIEDNNGSFYKNRNKYCKFDSLGYTGKAKVWSDFSGIEISLKKLASQRDEFIQFVLHHKSNENKSIQKIKFQIYINSRNLKDIFHIQKYQAILNVKDIDFNNHIDMELMNIIDIMSDTIEVNALNGYIIQRRDSSTGEITDFYTNEPMYFNYKENPSGKLGRIYSTVYRAHIPIKKSWYNSGFQYFNAFGLEFSYGNRKRKIPIKVELGIQDGDNLDKDELIGSIIGIPIIDSPLNKFHQNAVPVINFKGVTDEFYTKDKDYFMTIIENNNILNDEESIYDSNWTNFNFSSKGITYGLDYNKAHGYYRFFTLKIKNMNLSDKERVSSIEQIDYNYINNVKKESVRRKNIITIPKFDPKILINQLNSSIKENIKKVEDIVAGIYSQRIKTINLGNVAFYHMNVEILKQNSNENPYISLNNSVYLETKSSVSNKIIKAELSFNRGKIERKLNMNIKNSTKNGGGESGNIYIHLKPEEYKKFVDNGDKIEYNLKSSNNNELVFVGFNADKTPVPPVLPERKFKSKLVESITIISKLVNPIKGDIYFSERSPILKNEEISLINSNINYINQPQDGYDYNKTLALIGNVDKYNNSQGKHDFEIEDDRGNKISGVIGSSGGGSHWENLNIGGGNKISLFYKKDGNTYIKLDQWNYESSQGSLVVKHYTGSSNTVNQYYRLGFHLPKLDSFIYYDNSNSQIKKEEQIIKQLSLDSDIIDLGKLQLQNYDMEITKQKKGILTDEIGLRIEFQESVTLIEEETKTPYPMKGILKLIDKKEPNMNLTFLTGKGKSANLILELPKELPKSKTYKIESTNNNPIIKIGRTKYFKNLISGITLNKNPLIKGSSTLRFMPSYLDEDRINFNSIDYEKLEEISLKFPKPDGVILENIKGYGLLKSKTDDEIFINGISVGIVDKNENLNKKDILLKCGSIITIFFENGDLSLILKRNGASLERSENLNIYIKRKNEKITEHMFKLEFPSIWFIIKEKIPMDFGNVFIGEKNNLAKGEILIETSKEIKGNIKIEIKEKNIELFSMLKGKLNAQVENYYVSKGNLDDEYIINVNGKLDIPKEVVLGQYKGSVEVIISIKR